MLSNVSHPEMAARRLGRNEAGNLHTSQISHLRNQKMRMLGVKSLDALGRINTSAYAFRNDRREHSASSIRPRQRRRSKRFWSDSSQSLTRRLATLWTAAT